MAKEFVKGVTVGEATAEENTQPAVTEVETTAEETKDVIRKNEEDFIQGLIRRSGDTENRDRKKRKCCVCVLYQTSWFRRVR